VDQLKDSLYSLSPRSDAMEEILFQLRESEPNTLSLIMLGPLTNLAHAIQKDGPRLLTLSRVQRIFVMGGCIHHPTVCILFCFIFFDILAWWKHHTLCGI
jgi:inosine-uridine nucleoside N-ribohydrolase